MSIDNSVPMMNPLSKDMSFLRTSLLPGLLKAADFNIKNSSNSFKLYELGSVHHQSGNKIEYIKENIKLSGIVFGNESKESVHAEIIPYDLFSIKGYLYALLNEKLQLEISLEKGENILFEDACHIIVKEGVVGTFGKLSKKLFSTLKIDKYDIYGFDLDIDKILGQGKVIKGWDQGVKGMKEGGIRILIIPPELAYGNQNKGEKIPPNSTLVFLVHLLKVN